MPSMEAPPKPIEQEEDIETLELEPAIARVFESHFEEVIPFIEQLRKTGEFKSKELQTLLENGLDAHLSDIVMQGENYTDFPDYWLGELLKLERNGNVELSGDDKLLITMLKTAVVNKSGFAKAAQDMKYTNASYAFRDHEKQQLRKAG